MIDYFYSRGIIVLFLSAYCPFYNPIEYVFGMVKQRCGVECEVQGSENLAFVSALQHYTNYDCSKIFSQCGYKSAGYFDPYSNYSFYDEKKQVNTLTD
jgi:hypothetical protein